MKLRSVFRLAGILLPIGILTAALVDLRPWRPLEPRIHTDHRAVGEIRAGAGKAPVDLPRGIPLAGYRPFGRPASGPIETTYARTLLLEAGGVRTGIVLLELMTMPASLSDRIARRLRSEGIECALIAATHSHSGPGAYDRAFVPQAVAIGRFDPAVETALVDAVHASLVAAKGELSEAVLRAGERQVRIAENRDRAGEAVDDRLTKVEVLREDGTAIATILRASAHPTIAPRGVLSGDWPGVVMRGLEEEGGIGFVLQGASGDAKVEGEREVASFAQRVLDAARGVEARRIDESRALGCRMAEFGLPPPDLSAMVPRPLSRLVSNLVVPFAPRTSQVVELRLGSLSLLGVPAEPTASVGRRLEDAPGRTVRTVGLVGDYAGYAVQPADMEDRVFSARNAWFGAELADRLDRVRERLLGAGSEPRRPEASAP
jgi:hypothetical protein